jgi:23S rRNA (uracil1939-C5)-methyltransferase
MRFQKRHHREGVLKGRSQKVRPARSAEESRPLCPHYPHCIGCPFIDVPYPEQLTRKHGIVAQALEAFPSLMGVEIPPVAPSPRRLGYRARVKLVVRRTKGEVATGLYVPHSHRVMDISSCPVHPRPVNLVLHYLKNKLLELGICPYDERDDSGDLRYLDFRYSFAQRELSLTLVSRHSILPEAGRLARSLQRRFSFVAGVIQNVNEQRGNVIWGERFRTLGGRATILEQFGNLKLVFPAGVFSQANPFTARKLYESAYEMAALTGGETVLDLYCGVGPIALYLASAARQIWAIDDSEASITTARQNARRNGISNCRFVVGSVAEKVVETGRMLGHIELAVVNPPRKGIDAAAMKALLNLDVPRVIYVSCEPKSLARDLDRLVAAGYKIRRLQPFDMFPQTAEVETVVLGQKP